MSNSAATDAKKQPPGKTRRSRWSRNESQSASSRSSGSAICSVGATTSASKIFSAVSTVASWSSSFEPKWA